MGATDRRLPTVLVVTADPALAQRLRASVRAAGCRAATLATWAELEDALGHMRLDLVVAGTRTLPAEEGPASHALAGTPVVLIDDGGTAPPGSWAAVPFLAAPVDDAALVAAIRRALGRPG